MAVLIKKKTVIHYSLVNRKKNMLKSSTLRHLFQLLQALKKQKAGSVAVTLLWI